MKGTHLLSLSNIAMGLKIPLRAISADFMSLIGKYFQIRDDYMNLMDNEVRVPPSPMPQ
jgi:geranylgeranyl pyrophosphate synthase